MKAIEKIGLTKDAFKDLYESFDGFNDQFNKNHPSYEGCESFMSFLSMGCDKLINENKAVVDDIVNNCEEK